MTEVLNDLLAAVEHLAFDRRKAKRLYLNFPIEVSGTDANGKPFVENTKTVDISERGCRLITSVPLKRGERINVRLTDPDRLRSPHEAGQPFEVMWVQEFGTAWCIGARKLFSGDLWRVSFPHTKFSP